MDILLNILIRCLVGLAKFTRPLAKAGIGVYDEWRPGHKLKVLLVGYNGARNTGSDSRVVAITKQLKALFGVDRIQLTVMTLNRDTLKGYFDPDVCLLEFSSIFLWDLYKACSRHHAAILCEGSTLKSTFANALSLFLCEAAGIMASQGKPCIAYGSEVGQMESFLKKTAKQLCRNTYFITRTEGSRSILREMGLTGHVGTDTAWSYEGAIGADEAEQLLMKAGWDGKKELAGVAVIDPFCWPVRASLKKWLKSLYTGDSTGQYDKWYFFSNSPERQLSYTRYISEIAEAINRFCREQNVFPVIIGMERLDAKACSELKEKMELPCTMFLSGEVPADIMTGILRRLSYLVTSRYHAAVLSMESGIPIVSVSLDERLDGLMRELALEKNYLYHVSDPELGEKIYQALSNARNQRSEIAACIFSANAQYKEKLIRMGLFLKSYIYRRL